MTQSISLIGYLDCQSLTCPFEQDASGCKARGQETQVLVARLRALG